MSEVNVAVVVGIDVAKAHLDLAVIGKRFKERRIDNDLKNHQLLCKMMSRLKPSVVVMEASGGYEKAVADTLQSNGFKVAVVNARQVRDFAKGMGYLAKSDKLDARVIADFGAALLARNDIDCVLKAPRNPAKEALSSMIGRRRQLVAMQLSERQRLAQATPIVQSSISEMIDAIGAQIKDINKQIKIHVQQHHSELQRLLCSAAGIGPVASASLIAELPELGFLNRRQIASLVGVAPFARESGSKVGLRRIEGGRFEIRRTLYMATLTATQHNPHIRAYYEQLVSRGKLKKVALIACMRKLITVLNAMVKTGTTWDPEYNCA